MSEIDNIQNKYLLIIDDEAEIINALKRQFRKKYDVYTALSASEGYSIMKSNEIHVIISDQRMPDMTGVEFFSKIKHEYPDAIRLILTGYADVEAIIKAINDGNIFRYVTKPWDPGELDTIIKEAFEKYHMIIHNRHLMNKLKDINENLEEKISVRTRELAIANEELKRLNEEKNRFLGIAAHDLRTPIGAAFSFAQLLNMYLDSFQVSKTMQYLKIIQDSCSFALKLLNNLLDITKIESGKLILHIQEHDYIKLVQESLTINSIFADQKGISLNLNSLEDNLFCCFDSEKIKQTLDNLLSNAIKYSNTNTKIFIQIRKIDNYIFTEIIDQGQGIPKEFLDNIFQPFQRSNVQTTGGESSTGLGLAIVKKIIEDHNGEIGVKSEFGKGSNFFFKLPLDLKPSINIE